MTAYMVNKMVLSGKKPPTQAMWVLLFVGLLLLAAGVLIGTSDKDEATPEVVVTFPENGDIFEAGELLSLIVVAGPEFEEVQDASGSEYATYVVTSTKGNNEEIATYSDLTFHLKEGRTLKP